MWVLVWVCLSVVCELVVEGCVGLFGFGVDVSYCCGECFFCVFKVFVFS